MEFWFSELHTGNVKLSIKIEKQLFSGESEYQRIDVFDSEEFGKFISLDGEIVFSEKDEFIYDEMVTHVPMAVHPCVKDVLIIGGGDTGSDCLGTAIRQGAEKVLQIDLGPKPPETYDKSMVWPNWPAVMRTSTSQEEGGERDYAISTKEFFVRRRRTGPRC